MIQMQVLGRFKLSFKDQLLDLQPMEDLLFLGLVTAGGMASSDELVEMLWDHPTAGSAATARGYVSRIRTKARALASNGETLISTIKMPGRQTSYAIADGYRLDSDSFRQQVTMAYREYHQGDFDGCYAGLAEALSFWQGKPMPEARGRWWAISYIAELEETYKTAVLTKAKASVRLGFYREGAIAASRVVERWPDEEDAWMVLAVAQYRGGKADAAVTTCHQVIASLQKRGHNDEHFQQLQRAFLNRTYPRHGPLPE
jgi:DNA-binding SARP family transcriptional activator